MLTTPDGTILDANPAACKIFGRSLEEIRRIGRDGLVDTTDPRLHAAVKQRELKGEETAEITMLRANGEKFSAEISSKIYLDAKGRRKTSMIIRDMTERRKMEEEYRTLFRTMLDGFAVHEIICDAQGQPVDYRFLVVNPAFERMTGLKAENIVGRTVLEVLPETERLWIETYGRVALTGVPAFSKATLNLWINISKSLPSGLLPTDLLLFLPISPGARSGEKAGRKRNAVENYLKIIRR